MKQAFWEGVGATVRIQCVMADVSWLTSTIVKKIHSLCQRTILVLKFLGFVFFTKGIFFLQLVTAGIAQ